MPFTLAHPAFVLPLRHAPQLRAAPLILGAMVPDLPYFLPGKFQRLIPETHDFLASLTTDMALGYLALIVLLLLRRPLTALLAPRARWLCLHSLAPFTRRSSAWLWAAPALLLGIWSHLLWDSFTHTDGWVTRRVSALSAPMVIGPYTEPVAHVLQYLSSVVGLAVMVIWYLRLPAPARYPADPHAARPPVAPILMLSAAAAVLIGGVQASEFYSHTHLFYITMNILLTHSVAWFAALYLVAGLVVSAEHPPEALRAPGEEAPGAQGSGDGGGRTDREEVAALGAETPRERY